MKLALLAKHVEVMETIRRSVASVPLFVLPYHVDDPLGGARDRLGPGAGVVALPPLPEDDFIPGTVPDPHRHAHFAELQP